MKIMKSLIVGIVGMVILTNLWAAEWIQDTKADFSLGTCKGVFVTNDGFVQLEGKENWLSGWNYRRVVTIYNGTSSLSDYQVPIRFYNSGSIYSSGSQSIRVCDSNGTTILPFWIENWDNNSTATIWTKLDIPSGTKTVYLYYGNPSASNASNGTNTFNFFDDFSGNNINTSKWTIEQGNGYSIINNELKIGGGNNTVIVAKIAKNLDMTNYIFEGKMRLISKEYPGLIYNHYQPGYYYDIYWGNGERYYHSGSNIYTRTFVDSINWSPTLNVQYTFKFTGVRTDMNQKFYNNSNSLVKESNLILNDAYNHGSIGFLTYAHATPIEDIRFDDIRVRKYVAIEPIVQTGIEEGQYAFLGTFTSTVFNAGGEVGFGTLTWVGTTTGCGTEALRFQVSVNNSPFAGLNGDTNNYYTTAPVNINQTGNTVAYRSFFKTQDQSFTPKLDKVAIVYESTKEIVFDEESYCFYVERDYNQQKEIRIRNEANQTRIATIEVINTYDDLVIGLVGNGSGGSITLMPMEQGGLIINIHAPDATQEIYNIKVKLTSDNGITDKVDIQIRVRQPNINLKIDYIGENPDTLAKKYNIINNGDIITDLCVYLGEGLSGNVLIKPEINHGMIGKQETITVELIPQITDGWTGCKGYWYVDALGSKTHISNYAEWKLNDKIYKVTLDNPKIFFDMMDWYCINRPWFISNFSLPGFDEQDVRKAELKVSFVPIYPGAHKISIKINNNLIGETNNPLNSYTFPINRPNYLNYIATGTVKNSILVSSSALPNPGHYLTTAYMRIIIALNKLTVYVSAKDEASAIETAWSLPYIHKNSETLKVEISSPLKDSSYKFGESILVKAKAADNQGAIQWLCDVTADFNGTGQINLYDDGKHNDGGRDDGVYANYWNANQDGAVVVKVTANNCKTSAEKSVNIDIASNCSPIGTITEPNEGDVLKGLSQIEWTANDPDGDPLSYSLYYSISSIGPWTLLVENITQQNWEWNTIGVVNGSYYFRLLVSDGALTGEDIIRANVSNSVYGTIISPKDNEYIKNEITITGSAGGGGFSSYVLEYGEGNSPAIWTNICLSNTKVSSGILGEWDTNGLNGTYTIRLTVNPSGTESATDSVVVFVDNISPSVNISQPTDGASVLGTVTIDVSAQDTGSGLARVEFYINGKIQTTDSEPPYTFLWNTSGYNGKCEIKAVGWDMAGNMSEATHSIIVRLSGGAILKVSPRQATKTLYSQFNIGIIAENVYDLSGSMIELCFDKNMLKAISSECGTFFGQGSVTFYPIIKNDEGKVVINTSVLNGGISGTGLFATVTFQSVSSGTCQLIFGNTDLRNSKLERIPVGTISGTVIIKGFLADFGMLNTVDKIVEEPDYKIDFYDLMLFTDNWNTDNPRYDIGPATGTPPYLTPNPDGIVGFEDLSIFTMMWNWYYGTGSKSKTQSEAFSNTKVKIAISKQDGIQEGDEFLADLIVEDIINLMATRFEIGFDPGEINLVSIEGGEFLRKNRGTPVFLNETKEGRIGFNISILGGNPQGISGSGVIARIKFKALVNEPITRIQIISSDIRNLQNIKVEAETFDANIGSLPSCNVLLQSFPNPVADGCWIPFKLAGNVSNVDVEIYNIIGQKVKTISAGPRKAGSYTQAKEGRAIFWNKTNDSQQKVSKGLYFYKLKADDFSDVKSMVVGK